MKFDLQALNEIHAMLDRFVFSVGDKKNIFMILIITLSSNFAQTFGFYALFIKPKELKLIIYVFMLLSAVTI